MRTLSASSEPFTVNVSPALWTERPEVPREVFGLLAAGMCSLARRLRDGEDLCAAELIHLETPGYVGFVQINTIRRTVTLVEIRPVS